ncbi:MAG: NAD(P)/FAD-dependent oxidoreductase [Candidatus Omnitrophica bacterium]|nr:NAD(P)/FAD-dependent oxidoreductase [Candidatus Omnitrophota bacterium]
MIKYDFIIIGSGIGGSVLGALLSKSKKVLLLEKDSNLGGYCASFKRNGFDFDVAIEAVNGIKNGQVVYNIFKQSGVLKKSPFTKPAVLYRSIYPDYDLRFPQANVKAYKKILYNLFKNEKKGIDQLIDEMGLIYNEIDALDKKRKLLKSPNIMKYYKATFEDLLNKFIKNEKLKAIISQYWVYCGVPPSMLSAITFAYIWHDYTCNGSYYPKYGMGIFINECANVIRKNGGIILKESEVCKIHVSDKKAIGIELADKTCYKADAFISNIDLRKTFDMLSEKNEDVAKLLEKSEEKEASISAFRVYLGLDVDLKKLGINDSAVFINPGYDLTKMYYASVNNNIELAPISVIIYSNLSSTLCSKGKSVVSITMLSGYDFWKSLDKRTYKSTKEKMADKLIKRAEVAIPKLQQYIIEKVIATPLTMERYTGNSHGAIYGWSKNNLYDDIRFMKVTTPIKNLFLSSHWTKIGGGIAGVARAAEKTYRLLNAKGK